MPLVEYGVAGAAVALVSAYAVWAWRDHERRAAYRAYRRDEADRDARMLARLDNMLADLTRIDTLLTKVRTEKTTA